jgi:pimeloyl-ACP methyl ester carboxylesterase
MKEIVKTFGPQEGLVGILTTPPQEMKNLNRPAIILLNAGLIDRTGPYRLNVALARSLAAKGFIVLRFDFSGLGDSFTRKDNRSAKERSALDIQDAMDLLTKEKNIQEFVLLGLCVGADRAHQFGVMNSRVKGIVYLDGFTYKTPGYYLRYPWRQVLHFAQSILIWDKLKFHFKNYYAQLSPKNNNESKENSSQTYARRFPTKKQFESDVRSMLDRGACLFFIYTDQFKHYNYEGQFRKAFKSLCSNNKLRVKFFKSTDHLFSSCSRRKELIQSIGKWMQDQFPGNRAIEEDS